MKIIFIYSCILIHTHPFTYVLNGVLLQYYKIKSNSRKNMDWTKSITTEYETGEREEPELLEEDSSAYED